MDKGSIKRVFRVDRGAFMNKRDWMGESDIRSIFYFIDYNIYKLEIRALNKGILLRGSVHFVNFAQKFTLGCFLEKRKRD